MEFGRHFDMLFMIFVPFLLNLVASGTDHPQVTIVCKNDIKELKCSANQQLTIHKATYGREVKEFCQKTAPMVDDVMLHHLQLVPCVNDVTDIVQKKCEHKISCELDSTADKFPLGKSCEQRLSKSPLSSPYLAVFHYCLSNTEF